MCVILLMCNVCVMSSVYSVSIMIILLWYTAMQYSDIFLQWYNQVLLNIILCVCV